MYDPKMYLQQRPENGIWYFRRPIPKELQPFVNAGNKREFNLSLRAKSLTKEARHLHHEHWMESERLLDEARTRSKTAVKFAENCKRDGNAPVDSLKRRKMAEFSDEELVSLVQRWFLKEQAAALDSCRNAFSFGEPEERQADWKGGTSTGPDFETFATKRLIFEEAGGETELLKRGSAIFKEQKFTALVREALVMLTRYSLKILETGIPPAVQTASPELSQQALFEVSRKASSITLDELIERFDKDARKREVKPRTLDEFKLVYSLLRGFVGGDASIASITRDSNEGTTRSLREAASRFFAAGWQEATAGDGRACQA